MQRLGVCARRRISIWFASARFSTASSRPLRVTIRSVIGAASLVFALMVVIRSASESSLNCRKLSAEILEHLDFECLAHKVRRARRCPRPDRPPQTFVRWHHVSIIPDAAGSCNTEADTAGGKVVTQVSKCFKTCQGQYVPAPGWDRQASS